MKKIILLTIFFIIFIFCYTLMVPVKLYKRVAFTIANYFNIKGELKEADIDGYFFNEKECGYFSSQQGMVSYYNVGDEEFIQANRAGFIVYKKYGNLLNLYSPTGNKIKEIESFGYPYFSKEFPIFYTIKTNATGFSVYSINGDKLLDEINYNSIITSISTDKFLNTLVSTVEGKTDLYSIKKELLFSTESKESKINFVKTNIIEENSEYLAICAGIDPELIEIYNKNSQTLIKSIKTNNNYNRRIFLEFNNNKLYYESNSTLCYYDIKRKKTGNFVFNGELNEVKFDNNGNILIASSIKDRHYLIMYAPNSTILFYKEFNKKIENINFINEYSFYFRMENFIITMSKILV